MCRTKEVVKQREEPQPKPQVEQEETPQEQVKINHKDGGDLMIKKKRKTRRGGKTRHLMLVQGAKMMSKNEDEKKAYAHIKCFKCGDMRHFASKYPTKLEKKVQVIHERQGNRKHHMGKEEMVQ
jgi:RNase P subunit RPR2